MSLDQQTREGSPKLTKQKKSKGNDRECGLYKLLIMIFLFVVVKVLTEFEPFYDATDCGKLMTTVGTMLVHVVLQLR